jgi:hypothetical protein
MTGHRQEWYLDRLRAELERVAAIEDRRARSPAPGRLRPALDRLRPSPQTLVALAAVLALVAVVLAVARLSDVERPAAPPQPAPQPRLLPTNPPIPEEGCLPSQYWRAPIVDEPIPPAIASRIAIFRDPRPSGELPRDLPLFLGTAKKYRGVVTLRPRLDTGAQLRVDMIAADITTTQRDGDRCGPPLDPTVPGICASAFDPNGATGPQGTRGEIGCFSIEQIEDGRAWLKLTRQTIFGLAPDGAQRVTFDTPAGEQSLSISDNVFAGEIRSATSPDDPPPGPPGEPPAPPATNTRFTP